MVFVCPRESGFLRRQTPDCALIKQTLRGDKRGAHLRADVEQSKMHEAWEEGA
jgi:hypothetical protein